MTVKIFFFKHDFAMFSLFIEKHFFQIKYKLWLENNKPTQPYNISVLFGKRKRPSYAGSPLSVLSLLFICFTHVLHSCSDRNHMRHTYLRRLGDQGSLTGVN